MHSLDLIATLAGGMGAALVAGYLTHRAGLSPIVGYLLGGLIVGPHTPGFTANVGLAEQLAEIGVVLLMFGVGLQFHLDELLAVRRVALPGALCTSAAATALGALVALGFGWPVASAIVFGVALSVASTVVLVRVLTDSRKLHTPVGHLAVGWVVVEDLLTVVVLVLMPALAGAGASAGSLAWSLVSTALKVGGLVVFTAVVGARAIPWLLDRVAGTQSRELFTLTVLVLAMGIALGSAVVFGVSMALGAFLAGMVVGRSDYSLRAATEALPMRDAFAVLFFVSVGMLLDPFYLLEAPLFIAAALAVVMIGKPVVAALLVLLLGRPLKTAAAVAASLAQTGEFSFILGALGIELGALPPSAMNAIVAVALISIVVNPLLHRLVDPLDRWASRRAWLAKVTLGRAQDAATDAGATVGDVGPEHRAVVVGYGPTGRTLTRLLRDNGIAPTVIEMNVNTVRGLREQGISAVYGDASHRNTLEEAGAAHAQHLILTADLTGSQEIIRAARELRPDIHAIARTAYLRDLDALRSAGAQHAFSGEGEVAMALTEAVLQRLGATPEQMDRERARVRAELLGT